MSVYTAFPNSALTMLKETMSLPAEVSKSNSVSLKVSLKTRASMLNALQHIKEPMYVPNLERRHSQTCICEKFFTLRRDMIHATKCHAQFSLYISYFHLVPFFSNTDIREKRILKKNLRNALKCILCFL